MSREVEAHRSPPEPVVRTRGLEFAYGWGPWRRPALRGVDLHVPEASVTALVGPNGAGKTTLLRVLAGFLVPTRGAVEILGHSPTRYRKRYGLGYVPEWAAAPPGWTPRRCLTRAARLAGLPPEAWGALVGEALRRAGLTPVADDRAATLSRGQLRRLLLALALLARPRLLLLDEPMAGLDPAARVALRRILVTARRSGTTILLSTHDLAEVERLADRLVLLRRGTVERVLDLRGETEPWDLEQLFVEDLPL